MSTDMLLKKTTWEIPGGGVDEDESGKQAAIRELFEETGVQVEKVEKLCILYPLHSFNSEIITVYLPYINDATTPTTDQTEGSEHVIDQRYFSFEEVLQMIDTGEIVVV